MFTYCCTANSLNSSLIQARDKIYSYVTYKELMEQIINEEMNKSAPLNNWINKNTIFSYTIFFTTRAYNYNNFYRKTAF